MKRMLDIVASITGLLLLSPILIFVMLIVWHQDHKSPLYIGTRVGRGGQDFRMFKLRSMVVDADKTGIESTSVEDARITSVGCFIRRYKLDELTQLWNVFIGDMSLVGPRPSTRRTGVDLYTDEEKKLLTVRPGITDFSSIVFSDEGDILEGKADPDLSYNQLIRPWKSRLGIVYVKHHSFWLDLQLIFYTMVAIISKESACCWVVGKLECLGVDENVITVARREDELMPFPPPGADSIVTMRNT